MTRKIINMTLSVIIISLKLNTHAWAETTFFKNIAITKIEHQNGKLIQNDLVIQPYTLKYDRSKSFMLKGQSPIQPEYGKPIWTITPQQLPMTYENCLLADADLCNEHGDDYKDGQCIHSCIMGGPDSLAYDNKSGILYLSADSTAIGTGGGPFFLFAANINNKQIKFLKTEYAQFDLTGNLSPDGKNLLLYAGSSIVVYNTSTNKEFRISEKNNWNYPHQRLHYTGNIHWLSDTQFSYQIGVRHSKFQSSFDEMKENIFDIPSRKIISSRILGKNKYDSTPFTAMD